MNKKTRRRKTGGRDAKHLARGRSQVGTAAFIERSIPYYELLEDSALELIEHNAHTVLEEIGIEFRDFPEALKLLIRCRRRHRWRTGSFPRGICRSIIQASAPKSSPSMRETRIAMSIGGDRTVLVPAYGSPFSTISTKAGDMRLSKISGIS